MSWYNFIIYCLNFFFLVYNLIQLQGEENLTWQEEHQTTFYKLTVSALWTDMVHPPLHILHFFPSLDIVIRNYSPAFVMHIGVGYLFFSAINMFQCSFSVLFSRYKWSKSCNSFFDLQMCNVIYVFFSRSE